MITMPVTTESNCLKKHDDSFWMSLNIFAEFVRKGQTGRDQDAILRRYLKNAKKPNCRFLAARLGFDLAQITDDNIPSTLLAADDSYTLRLIADFFYRKSRAVKEEYYSTFSVNVRQKHLAELRDVGKSQQASLSPFAMLLLLLEHAPDSLMRVYCRHLWRQRKTDYEYESSTSITTSEVATCKKHVEALAHELEDTTSGREFRFVHTGILGRGFEVFFFQREQSPQIRLDYKEKKNILHGVSWFMLGIHQDSNRIILKNATKTQNKVVIDWFKNFCETTLTECTAVVFENYDPERLELRLLGNLPETAKTSILRVNFKRTLLPEHGGLEFFPAHKGMSIHADLMDAKERGIIRVRSLSDIVSITLLWGDDEVVVKTEVDRMGATTLRLNNAALSEEQAEALKVAFQDDFGVPLNKKIKPQLLDMGNKDVFAFLMEAKRRDEVADYQNESLESLLGLKVLKIEPQTVRVCSSGGCPRCDQQVSDEECEECPECQNPLEQKEIERIVHDDKVIRKVTKKILEKALDHTFSLSDDFKFEKRTFFPLGDPHSPQNTVSILFASRIQQALIEDIGRYNQPVLIVHTRGHEEHAYLDTMGIAHLGFAYAVSAYIHAKKKGYENNEVWERFATDCQGARARLIRQRGTAVLRAAEKSLARLEKKDAEKDKQYNSNNQDFETDVYNLLRCVFPYTQKWGGANRPDGMCSLLFAEAGDASQITKFNWSYDAKHSWEKTGYDFGISEKRKVFDYVEKLCKQKELLSQGNHLDAHVIISNNLSDSKIADSVKYLAEDHRLGKREPSVLLVLMTQGFLMTLYEEFTNHQNEMNKRWTYLSEKMAAVMQIKNDDGFVRLDVTEGKAVVQWVLDQTPIEMPADATKVKEGMQS